MTSERIVLLSILTACIYATIIFAESGMFILPFGVFKPALFALAVVLVIVNKRFGWQEISLLLATFSLAISSKLLLQLVISDETLNTHMPEVETFVSFSLIAFTLFFLLWQVLIAWEDKTQFRWLQIVNALVMLTCIWMNMYAWLIVPTLMWLMSVFLSRNQNPMHKSYAGLFGFVVLSTWISGLVFGADVVLGIL
jgi:hypothetical protein